MENDIAKEKEHLQTLLSAIESEKQRHASEMLDLQEALISCKSRLAEMES